MMIREAGVIFEGVQQFQALRRTVHHRRRDRVIQRDHWVVGHAPVQIVERQDLLQMDVL